MASEAQRLIGISLTKIAQSRSHRGGVSLHKNLLVATVLQKARYIFMEEAYNIVHFQRPVSQNQSRPDLEKVAVGLTVEEAGLGHMSSSEEIQESSVGNYPQSSPSQDCDKCCENQNKENHSSYTSSEATYEGLDVSSKVLRERSESSSACLKRRRAVTELETEEAVLSILPKKSKQSNKTVFFDDVNLLTDIISEETAVSLEKKQENSNGSAMEIDRITSLVSIFSFSMGDGKLMRSVSTPDLCSTQAKDTSDGIPQRSFLAMTV